MTFTFAQTYRHCAKVGVEYKMNYEFGAFMGKDSAVLLK